MLVNINEDILKLLELENLEDTEDKKEVIENVVNSYLVGGIYTAVLQGVSSVNKEEIENLMDYYPKRMLSHTIKKCLVTNKKSSLH